jgi:predicted DNA-binding transcriptional regulator AlpA
MKTFSTGQAAKKLGISAMSLSRYIKVGKVPAPQIFSVGGSSLHAWTEEEIENVRKLLPKIANGRKTRYQKITDKKKEGAQAGASPPQPGKPGPSRGPGPVPHKPRKTKKKK